MAVPGLVVAGIKGRMGRQIAGLALGDERFEMTGGTVSPGDPVAGKMIAMSDAAGETHQVAAMGGLADFETRPAVIIDFTAPSATMAALEHCVTHKIAMVIGTTGFSGEDEAKIADAATSIAIVKSGNMSLGVNLLTTLVEQAARALGPDFDIEIHEAHHRHKKDAPSGTALMLGEAAATGRGVSLDAAAVHERHGQTGARPDGAIGFSVTRAGGIIGEHSVMFGSEEETLTLSHSAIDRAVFARGALAAAGWAVADGRQPGCYTMRDVLGL